MGRISVHVHGAPKDRHAAALMAMYLDRLRNQGVACVKHSDKLRPAAYYEHVSSLTGTLVLMDEFGETSSSEAFARRVKGWRLSTDDVHLAIGPAEGWPPQARETTHVRLSLSEMTFPHELAAVMLVEQLYRSMEILRGSAYHKA